MDNQCLDITSEGTIGIGHALAILWRAATPGGLATHYKVAKYTERTNYYCYDREGQHRTRHSTRLEDDPKGCDTLILLWSAERDATSLPFPLNQEQAADFIRNWLGTLDYGTQPDHDGSNGKGWRLFTEAWGHVAGHHYAIVGVQPAWAMYGK